MTCDVIDSTKKREVGVTLKDECVNSAVKVRQDRGNQKCDVEWAPC